MQVQAQTYVKGVMTPFGERQPVALSSIFKERDEWICHLE